MTNQDTIDAAAGGDRDAVEALLVEHLGALQAYIRLNTGPLVRAHEQTTDLVQSVCREVLERAGDFEYRGAQAFRRWLFTTALHKIMNRARDLTADRRDKRREVGTPSSPAVAACYASIVTPSRVAMGKEAIDAFEAVFDELNDDYRHAITLRRIANLDYPEIANAMDRSEGAVRNLVYRGLAKLAADLERAGLGDPT